MATIDDVLAFVAAHPKTYGNALHSRSDLWAVIEDLPGKTAAEKLYNYKHPGAWEASRKCKACVAGPMPFRAGKYQAYCSSKCRMSDPVVKAATTKALSATKSKRSRDIDEMLDFVFRTYRPPYKPKFEPWVDPLHKAKIVEVQPVATQSSWVEAMLATRQQETAEVLEAALS